jgi:hypothetical protein
LILQRLLSANRERHVFFAMLVLCLVPIWLSGRFFLTGDGPCHVYNARILLDLIRGHNADFYQAFYTLNVHFDSNWSSHILLALLQSFSTPEVAEKLFLSGYVLLFAYGLRRLLRTINPTSAFVSTFGLLFVWHHLLQAGFYNFALSIALFFWVCTLWLTYRSAWTWKRIALLTLLWVLLYATHPVGLGFSIVFVAAGAITEFVMAARKASPKTACTSQRRQLLGLVLAAIPMLLLFGMYLARQPLTPSGTPATLSGLLNDIAQARPLMTLDTAERDMSRLTNLLITLLTLLAVYFRRGACKFADFLLVFVAFTFAIYFLQAGASGFELMMHRRIQPFLWIGILLWVSTATFPKPVRRVVPFVALAMMIIFLTIRMPILKRASVLTNDYISCLEQIEESSAILVLNYNFNGLDREGQDLTNRNWIFIHAADYLGAYQPSIMSDNYEALRNYFPLQWKSSRNMYVHTAIDGINFENRPPRADIRGYNTTNADHPIDYVLLLCYQEKDARHPYAQEILEQLEESYTLEMTSPLERAQLWKRNE